MPPEAVLSLGCSECPRLVATSLPGRDYWALEELMDTVVARDPAAKVKATGYRGVFEVLSGQDPQGLAVQFLMYNHAFIARVLPVLACAIPVKLKEALSGLGLSGLRARLEFKAREPLKGTLTEDLVRSALASAGVILVGRREGEVIIDVESLGKCVIISFGEPRSCGPRCTVLVPSRSL